MKKILIPLAPGFEEIEALSIVDILRRGGAEVVTSALAPGPVEGRNRIKVLADTTIDEIDPDDYDLVVLPGGAKGTENLINDPRVIKLVRDQHGSGKLVAAICAAPTVLAKAGILKKTLVTCHPSVTQELRAGGFNVTDERVVVDGIVITSQGPGTAIEFALRLVELLFDKDKVEEVNRGVLARI